MLIFNTDKVMFEFGTKLLYTIIKRYIQIFVLRILVLAYSILFLFIYSLFRLGSTIDSKKDSKLLCLRIKFIIIDFKTTIF